MDPRTSNTILVNFKNHLLKFSLLNVLIFACYMHGKHANNTHCLGEV